MALLFCDSFDHYATAEIIRKWATNPASSTYTSIQSSSGRRSGGALRLSNSVNNWTSYGVTKAIPDTDVVYFGTAIKNTVLDTNEVLLGFIESGVTHVSIYLDSTGALRAYRGATTTNLLGASAAGVFSTNVWRYLEAKVVIHDTTGSVELKLDGTSVLSLTNQDTNNAGASGVVNTIGVQAASNSPTDYTYFDDLYICDDAGSANNTYLGDIRVDAYLPSGNGNSSGMTGSDADSTNNYLLVDDATTDDDTSYVESSSVSTKDTYAFTDMSHTPLTIKGIQINAMAEKTLTGSRSLAHVTRSSSTDYDSSSMALASSYTYYQSIREVDPATSSAWSKTNLNSAEFGVKVAS